MAFNIIFIYCGITFITIVNFVLIAASVLDIVFDGSLQKSGTVDVNVVRIQIAKVVLQILRIVGNIVFLVAFHGSRNRVTRYERKDSTTSLFINWFQKTTLIYTIPVGLAIYVLRNILCWLNIFRGMGLLAASTLSGWKRFEMHPVSIFLQIWSEGGVDFIIAYAVLKYCYGRRIFQRRNTVFGLDIRNLLYLHAVFMVLHCAATIRSRFTVFFLDADLRDEIAAKGPSFFIASASAPIVIAGWTVYYFYDIVYQMKKNCPDFHKRLRRNYQITTLVYPLYQPAYFMVRIRQKDVFGSKNDPGIEIYLVNSIILCYAVGMHICVYMYYEYLKNVQMYATEGSSYTNIIARQNHFSINMIARKSIKVENGNTIGSGFSSVVFTGVWTRSFFWKKAKSVPVAVKVLSANNLDSDGVATVLVEEFKNLSRLMELGKGNHPHLVTFYGGCFQESGALISPLGRVNIVLELCENGSLEDYLPKLKDRGSMLSQQGLVQLNSWAFQVAKGMKFLSSHNIIHGDLAARNVLLDERLIAKISDFGMSRKLYHYQVYVSTNHKAFPYKYMAPESLDQLEFSPASDVWSYGVLLWEMYTLGESPWGERPWTSNFGECLRAGERLQKPLFAPQFFYKLMCQCWMIEKEERLTFSQVTEKLEEQAKGNVGSRRGKSMRQVVKDQELSRCELGELGSSDAYIIP